MVKDWKYQKRLAQARNKESMSNQANQGAAGAVVLNPLKRHLKSKTRVVDPIRLQSTAALSQMTLLAVIVDRDALVLRDATWMNQGAVRPHRLPTLKIQIHPHPPEKEKVAAVAELCGILRLNFFLFSLSIC